MMQDRMSTAFGAAEAAAFAREYAGTTMTPRRRRQRTRQLARRVMAAWRAWQAAGEGAEGLREGPRGPVAGEGERSP